MDGLKEGNWTVVTSESRRCKRLEVDGPKGSKRMVQKTDQKEKKLDGIKEENWTMLSVQFGTFGRPI